MENTDIEKIAMDLWDDLSEGMISEVEWEHRMIMLGLRDDDDDDNPPF